MLARLLISIVVAFLYAVLAGFSMQEELRALEWSSDQIHAAVLPFSLVIYFLAWIATLLLIDKRGS